MDKTAANPLTPPPPAPPPLTPSAIGLWAAQLYHSEPRLLRFLHTYRPYVCPFESLIAQIPRSSTLLDVGCGGGLLPAVLAATGRIRLARGFDSSPSLIALANRAASRIPAARSALASHPDSSILGPPADLSFLCLAAEADWPEAPDARPAQPDHPLQGGQQGEGGGGSSVAGVGGGGGGGGGGEGGWDVVTIVDVMHHVPPIHQPGVIARAAAALRPGGVLIYKDMCRSPAWRALANRTHDLLIARQWIHYAPVSSVESWARSHSLSLLTSLDESRWVYGHELRVFRKE